MVCGNFGFVPGWGSESIALVEQARVLSGNKLAQLVRRLQRQTGRTPPPPGQPLLDPFSPLHHQWTA